MHSNMTTSSIQEMFFAMANVQTNTGILIKNGITRAGVLHIFYVANVCLYIGMGSDRHNFQTLLRDTTARHNCPTFESVNATNHTFAKYDLPFSKQ